MAEIVTRTEAEVREIFYSQISMLKQTKRLWILDKKLIGIDPKFIEAVSQRIPIEYKRVDGEKWDCDDIAKNAAIEVKKWWKGFNKDDEALIFGVGLGIRWNGVDINHTANVFVFKKQVYCYDFQTDECWPTRPGLDLIYKVDI